MDLPADESELTFLYVNLAFYSHFVPSVRKFSFNLTFFSSGYGCRDNILSSSDASS